MYTLLWMCAGAMGLWLGMPNPLYQLPILALLYPAALFALGRSATSWRQALRSGWLCGLAGASACMYWVAIPVHEFGGLPWPLAAPCALFIGAYIGLYGGLFAALSHALEHGELVLFWGKVFPKKAAQSSAPQDDSTKARRRAKTVAQPGWILSANKALALGLGWYLLEWIRGWFLTGFPWLSLASAFAPWPVLLQGVSVVGTYGLSGMFVGLLCLILYSSGQLGLTEAKKMTPDRVTARLPFWGGLMGFALLAVFGWWRMEIAHPIVPLVESVATGTETAPDSGVVRSVPVTLVQGNLDQNVKWEPAMQRLTVQRYLTLSSEALAFPEPDVGRPKLLIWPETAMPFNYQLNQEFPAQIRAYARERNIALMFGAPGFRKGPVPGNPASAASLGGGTIDKNDTFNRAYLITAGVDSNWYEKEHLVPFGEYMPPYLDIPFLRPLLQGVGNFTSGEKILPLHVVLPGENHPDGPLVLGVLICYETVFPELARQRVADGAEVFVNISNDAWFGFSAAPEQHLQLTLLRAVEQGRWLMRATNTGISAFIDPLGRIRARSALFKAQTLSALVPPLTATTVFFHVGPWLPALALVLFLWLVVRSSPLATSQHKVLPCFSLPI